MAKATKKDIIDRIAMQNGLTKTEAMSWYRSVVGAITSLIQENDGVSCVGLGTFKWHDRKARKARNPKSGQEIWVDAKSVVKFRPGPNLDN